MLIGIAVPVYFKLIKKAGEVSAGHNLKVAQTTVDGILIGELSPTGGTYSGVDTEILTRESNVTWWELEAGETLPAFKNLDSKQKNTIYIVRPKPNEIYTFVITLDKEIKYASGSGGAWRSEDTVSYEQGISGIVTTSGV